MIVGKKMEKLSGVPASDGNIVFKGKEYPCGTSLTMDYIGGKWKAAILWYLQDGKKRFTALNKQIPQMTERILSIQLKQLEEDGVVIREVFTEKPPLRVEYSLTEFGKTLIPVLQVVAKWGSDLGQPKSVNEDKVLSE